MSQTQYTTDNGNFLERLYNGRLSAGERIGIWTINPYVMGRDGKPRKTTTMFTSPAEADAYALTQRDKCDVYFHMCPTRDSIQSGRISAKQVSSVRFLWADTDILNLLAHKKTDLPASLDEAQSLFTDLGLPPSIMVNSGHGLHAYWLLDRPLAPQEGAILELWLITALQGYAAKRGWNCVDPVADLARVLRVPGTLNHKDQEHLCEVSEITASGVIYTVETIDAAITHSGFHPEECKASKGTVGRVKAALAEAREAVDKYDLLEDADVLAKAYKARNADKFRALYDEGTLLLHGGDHSAADAALVMMLAFYTDDDPRQIDRLFAKSALFRPKWDTIHTADGLTYGQYTIANMIEKRLNAALGVA